MDRNTKIAFGVLTAGLIYLAVEHMNLVRTYNSTVDQLHEAHEDMIKRARDVLQLVHNHQFEQIVENLDEEKGDGA